MIIKIWLDNPLNDATTHYLELIERAFSLAGMVAVRVVTLDEVSGGDYVLTLHAKATCQILMRNRRARIITWFQGIVPEEAMLWQGKRMPNFVYKAAWEVFEFVALKFSVLSIFVSDAMRLHYARKYKLRPPQFQVIPCFNMELSEQSFFHPDKYTSPRFVYAGSMDSWQCVEEMLKLFGEIERTIPNASLMILTAQQDAAKAAVARHSLRNVTVSYVKLAELDVELAKYKYGFLLRRDHPINNVATPTKMNTYLSCGILPIYTTAIWDFEQSLSGLKLALKVDDVADQSGLLEQLSRVEAVNIRPEEMLADYRNIFDSYYCADRYVDALAGQLTMIFGLKKDNTCS